VIDRVLAPWRTASTWRLLVHAVLDIPVGVLLFVPTVTLLAMTLGLAPTLLFAVIPLLLVLFFGHAAAAVERSRYAALHDLALADPVPRPPSGSLWTRLKARVVNKPRWKEIAYCVLRLPVSILIGTVVLLSWCGSLALLGLPFYVEALPGETAQFGLFGVSFGVGALLIALVGAAALLAVAPWVTIVAARLDAAVARWLLAPRADAELAAQVERAESGRAAAIGAAEAERRRIERDLHDGAQQRLVALAMDLGAARERLESDPEGGKALVAQAHEEAKAALKEIRDLVRGIHPVILEDRGLDAALSAVVARSPIPVELDVELDGRPPADIESAAYFVVSEALANVARHAHATRAHVGIARTGDRLVVEVRDDGIGGADPAAGTGLAGLADRVTAMGGTMDLLSPRGGPTTLLVELPCGS
jgi:signal transduction histidine kinase